MDVRSRRFKQDRMAGQRAATLLVETFPRKLPVSAFFRPGCRHTIPR